MSELKGVKVHCADSRVYFSRKDSAIHIECPHMNAELGVGHLSPVDPPSSAAVPQERKFTHVGFGVNSMTDHIEVNPAAAPLPETSSGAQYECGFADAREKAAKICDRLDGTQSHLSADIRALAAPSHVESTPSYQRRLLDALKWAMSQANDVIEDGTGNWSSIHCDAGGSGISFTHKPDCPLLKVYAVLREAELSRPAPSVESGEPAK